jgi:predicted RNase H-like nuclease (RuvC/YqgF family)
MDCESATEFRVRLKGGPTIMAEEKVREQSSQEIIETLQRELSEAHKRIDTLERMFDRMGRRDGRGAGDRP